MMARSGFRPARTRRAFEEVIDQIQARVRSGEIQPGDRLPSEREMAEQFAVGRNTVREALRMLELTGIVELRRGATGGAFITAADPRRLGTSMTTMLGASGFGVGDLTEARRWVEAVVVRIACGRMTDEVLDALEENVVEAARLADSTDWKLRAAVHLDFHRILADASGNPVMIAIVHGLMGVMFELVLEAVPEYQNAEAVVDCHRRFLDALRRQDVETAVAEMDSHLRQL
jgi:GntR family transcriptional repressor for pyruvate dehydrogenase complex